MLNNLSAQVMRGRRVYARLKKIISTEQRNESIAFLALRKRYYQEYWQKVSHSLGASLEDIGEGFYRINKGKLSTYVKQSDVMLDDHLSLKIAGNKPLTHKLLSEIGYTGPRYFGYSQNNIDKALEFMESLDVPVVVKPASSTGAGHGITTDVRTEKQLIRATVFASTISPNLLIEEQIQGDSYRLLYLDGQFIDAVRRDQPVLTGDGVNNIKNLIKMENDKRVNSGTVVALSPLTVSDEMHVHLRKQEMTLSSIPEHGKTFSVKTVINENSSNENHIVRDQVHSSIVNLGANLIKVLDLKLVGVDLITPDISKPLDECGGVINELNTTPGLHHHDLVFEKDLITNVGEQIIDYIFQQKRDKNDSMWNLKLYDSR